MVLLFLPILVTSEYTEYRFRAKRQNLTDVPKIRISKHYTAISIDLKENSISAIKAGAFMDIPGKQIEIDLSSNHISTIDNEAFRGVERNITSLELQDNRLTKLPGALSKLTGLTALDVRGNPILNFNVNIMQALGLTLTSFKFGSAETESWGASLHYLHRVGWLDIYNIRNTSIPADPFRGFKQNLVSLTLKNSSLTHFPPSVCPLKNLTDLTLSNNSLGIGGHFHIPCQSPFPRVSVLSLSYNGFDRFPNLYNTFPNVQSLYLIGNPLISIGDETDFSGLSQLFELRLQLCSLESFPSALSTLPRLGSLVLQDNRITRIRRQDLQGFHSLQDVDLDRNPLTSISPSAFSNTSLTRISLKGTGIHTIPPSIAMIEHSISLSLKDNVISCGCDLVWIENWKYLPTSDISGSCAGHGPSIQTFVNAIPRDCPRIPVG